MLTLDSPLNTVPAHVRHVYFMGIGGVAMGALAGALQARGYTVRGSDNPLYPPMSDFLAGRGIVYASGYQAENLSGGVRPDLVIIGNVIRRDNPEALACERMKLHYISLPQALRHFFIASNLSIVVAGTHGKTTTTALLAWILRQAGKKPGYMVGGLVGGGLDNFAPSEREAGVFVTEGDEYDTAFFDKRPKFIHYNPQIGILTSCEFDHGDIYADMRAVSMAFNSFARLTSRTLIAWGDSDEVMACAANTPARLETYGWAESNRWRLRQIKPAPAGGMDVYWSDPEGSHYCLHTPLLGEHNALNLLAAISALKAAGLDTETLITAQESFPGVARRLQERGAINGVMVVDDFAHHPTAVKKTIAALDTFGMPGWRRQSGRLLAVFEPRSNTSRSRIFQHDYAASFDQADLVFLRAPGRAEDTDPNNRLSVDQLAADINARSDTVKAQAFHDSDRLLAALLEQIRPGDLCLVMSNGPFDGLHEKLLQKLKQAL
ncbi:MAG: Mur ligase domain-containing protein [Desulfarculales bacterium]|jgi:UDP-N-acetylmuramate: L-alanyl-gamma-D-glutamyl-meso-diaminopimelate ligase|nr:Mur ligase domain-containing protein [Desulfarculales bacterium]